MPWNNVGVVSWSLRITALILFQLYRSISQGAESGSFLERPLPKLLYSDVIARSPGDWAVVPPLAKREEAFTAHPRGVAR